MRKRLVIGFLATVALLIGVFFAWASIYYRADASAIAALESTADVSVTSTDYGYYFDGPAQDKALVFYPGAKVEASAYAPLLHELAEADMDVCLVEMPFRLAFMDANKADAVMGEHVYEHWYVGGHSLGGAMAASYAADHADELDGVILFAAYPVKELDDGLAEVVLYGSEDNVLNAEKLIASREYAPKDYTEHVIVGGNHAQFGSYGAQSGDGAASISAQEQWAESVALIEESLT